MTSLPSSASLIALISALGALSFCLLIGQFALRFVRHYQSRSSDALDSLFWHYSSQQILPVSLVLAMVTALITFWWTQNPILSAAPFVTCLAMPLWLLSKFQARRNADFSQRLPGAIESMAQAMKAGISFTQAFEATTQLAEGPIAEEFSLVLRQLRMGASWEDALHQFAKRMGNSDCEFLVASILISREVGGNLSDILLNLSQTMRRVQDVEKKIDALTAQGRMQGKVMTALPLFLGACLYFLEPNAMGKLWTTPTGWLVLGLALFLLSVGYVFIKKIIGVKI